MLSVLAIPFFAAQSLGWLIFVAGAVAPLYIAFGMIGLSGFREVTRFAKYDSFYYGLNPGTKLLALFLVALSIPRAGLYLALFVTSVILVSYLTLIHGRRKLWIGSLLTAALVWGTVWSDFSGFLPNLISGVSQGFGEDPGRALSFLPRLIAEQFAVSGVFLLALLVIMTTTPSDLMRALRKVQMPNPITFSLTVGMRSVPLLLDTINSTVKVELMRGFGRWGRKRLWPLYILAATLLALIPALILVLRSARGTAISTGTRAFGAYRKRTYVRNPPFGAPDVLTIGLAGATLAAALLL